MCTARSSVMRLLAVVACLAAYTGCSCAAPLALRDGAGKLTEFQAAMTEGSRTRRASDFAADTWGRCTTMKKKFCNRRFVQKRCCTTCQCRKPTTNGKRARRATADENQAVGHSGTLLSAATSPSAGSAPAPTLDRNARGWTLNCANMGPYCNIAFVASICPAVCADSAAENLIAEIHAKQAARWCNNDKAAVMSSEWQSGYEDPEECIAKCQNHAACAWVGFRRHDKYCEFWGAGSCQNPHYQSGHDIYKPREPDFFTRRTPYGGQCEVPLTEEQCREYRTAAEAGGVRQRRNADTHPRMALPLYGFAHEWPSLPHGCQLFESSPDATKSDARIVFNRANSGGSDRLNIHNHIDMGPGATCKDTAHWCYASQSRMVCPADECKAPLDSDAPNAVQTAGPEFSTVDDWNAFKLEPEYLRERDTSDYADYEAARKELGLPPTTDIQYMCYKFPNADQNKKKPCDPLPYCEGLTISAYAQQNGGASCREKNFGIGGRKQ